MDRAHTFSSYVFKTYFNIILASMSKHSCLPSFKLHTQNLTCISDLSYVSYLLGTSYPLWFYHHSGFCIAQTLCSLLISNLLQPHKSKCHQHSSHKHPQIIFVTYCVAPSRKPTQSCDQNDEVHYIVVFICLLFLIGKIKVSLWNRLLYICVYMCMWVSVINFWMQEPLFMKLDTFIMALNSILTE